MSDHYYSQTPSSGHSPRRFDAEALGQTLTFHTDAGVFSKNELDPGSLLLLRALPPLSGRVLDLGCGWGAIGVTLGKAHPQAQFVLSDINERAVALAQKNIRANGLANAQALQSDGFERVEGRFDCIVSNPPIRAGKARIYALFDEAKERLNPGGALFIVIRKQQGAASAQKHLLSVFGSAEIVLRDKGYWILKAKVMGGDGNI